MALQIGVSSCLSYRGQLIPGTPLIKQHLSIQIPRALLVVLQIEGVDQGSISKSTRSSWQGLRLDLKEELLLLHLLAFHLPFCLFYGSADLDVMAQLQLLELVPDFDFLPSRKVETVRKLRLLGQQLREVPLLALIRLAEGAVRVALSVHEALVNLQVRDIALGILVYSWQGILHDLIARNSLPARDLCLFWKWESVRISRNIVIKQMIVEERIQSRYSVRPPYLHPWLRLR